MSTPNFFTADGTKVKVYVNDLPPGAFYIPVEKYYTDESLEPFRSTNHITWQQVRVGDSHWDSVGYFGIPFNDREKEAYSLGQEYKKMLKQLKQLEYGEDFSCDVAEQKCEKLLLLLKKMRVLGPIVNPDVNMPESISIQE